MLPVLLFLATCLSTFTAAAFFLVDPADAIRIALPGVEILVDPHSGLLYMLSVMAILLAHEMGHFLQALRYHVPASLPMFIPMPLTPIGTMGAVIGMRGSLADRKELFDIGLTGPLAGLLVALPVAWWGIWTADYAPLSPEALRFHDPLLFKLMIYLLRPDMPAGHELILNPFLLAGWVAMLVTGLNMLPVSQLDGGHVAYALFGRRAHLLAWGVIAVALVFVALFRAYGWLLMITLVLLIGPAHPPTSNDAARLGWFRRLLGLVSLLIPIFCLAPIPISGPGM